MTNTQKVATENANQKRIEELRKDPSQRWPGYEIEAQEYEERTRCPECAEERRARSQGLVQPGIDKYGNETEGA